jgi:hypothetical protein
MAPSKAKKPKGQARLSFAQIEVVGQFNDYAWENSKLSFEEVARKELGPNPFPKTPNGQKFISECKEVFDREAELEFPNEPHDPSDNSIGSLCQFLTPLAL